METEPPEWTKKISNNTVCSYYYIIFLIAVIAGILAVISLFIIPFLKGVPPGLKAIQMIGLISQGALAIVASLAAYLVCHRALVKTVN